MGIKEEWFSAENIGVGLSFFGQALAIAAALLLLNEPYGARIRPLANFALLFIAAAIGLSGSVLSFVALVVEREKRSVWKGVISIVVGLLVFPVGIVLIRYVIDVRQIVILP